MIINSEGDYFATNGEDNLVLVWKSNIKPDGLKINPLA